MDLSTEFVRDSLHLVDIDGWDSAAGRQLLDHVRRAVVVPVVRRSGLRGPAADQAEASGWEAAWDALRRPTARTALNPGGMVWVAVRRAVAAETEFTRVPGGTSVGVPAAALVVGGCAGDSDGSAGGTRLGPLVPPLVHRDRRPRCLSLEDLMDRGWHPEGGFRPVEGHGPAVDVILDGLVAAGWDRATAGDAIAMMADHAVSDGSGAPTTRWRWASLKLGVPEWQARRLAGLLLGDGGSPGVLELMVRHGSWVTGDPAVESAVLSTTARWSASPGAFLAGWDEHLQAIA